MVVAATRNHGFCAKAALGEVPGKPNLMKLHHFGWVRGIQRLS
jgi:hypothetical protein